MKDLVSVIVPIYNTESYLKRCIDSIINQDYTNLEIILIDDGSTDKSYEICKNYSKKDKRIITIHSENRGVSSARNIGIKNSSGEKIIFVDSDDYLEKDYISSLMNNKKFDFVITGFKMCGQREESYIPKEQDYLTNNEVIEAIIKKENQLFVAGPCLKLFNLDIIKKYNILFDETLHYGEDTCFVYSYIKFVNSLKIISNDSYCNYIREGSLSRKIINDPWNSMYKVFKTGISLYDDKKIYNKEITEIFLRCFKLTCYHLFKKKTSKKDIINKFNEIRQIEEFSYISNDNLNSFYNRFIIKTLKRKNYKLLYFFLKLKNLLLG